MPESLNPRMVVLARELRRLTQSEVAQRLGCAQGTLSKVENGQLELTPELAVELARLLEVPRSFFYEHFRHKSLPLTFYRKRLRVSSSTVKAMTAKINVVRLHVERLARSAELPPLRLPSLNVEEYGGDVRRIASELRVALHVPPGPIDNLTKTLEDAGVLIINCDLGTNQIDGLSIYEPDDLLPPIILINPTAPGDRLRFTIAHELMHIVLHHHLPVPGPNVEAEANEGASEFLLPAADIRGFLGNVTVAKLGDLKNYWKVSMQALTMRACDLGKISERQKRSLFVRMNQYGWRVNEPVFIPREEPTLISELIEFHLSELGYSEEDLSRALSCELSEFLALYRGVAKPPQLRVVKSGSVVAFRGK